MIVRRLPLLLCMVNWTLFLLFLTLREPRIDHADELEASWPHQNQTFRTPGRARLHIAARPLYDWNQWHGGESFLVKSIEVVNLPALIGANLLTPATGSLFFPRSGSYYLDTWIRAWLFLVLATIQWACLGALLRSLLRHWIDINHDGLA